MDPDELRRWEEMRAGLRARVYGRRRPGLLALLVALALALFAAVLVFLASGCYAAHDESTTCPAVEAAWEEARELHGCDALPETLEACPLRCVDLRFDAERAEGRTWRADPEDLVRVFGAARDCGELAGDADVVCEVP